MAQKAIVMKFFYVTLVIAVLNYGSGRCYSQSFMNLNFELASNLPGSGTYVYVTDALPGWSAYGGGSPLNEVYFASNTFTAAYTTVELEGGSLALSGDFSVGLFLNGSISQTGTVPAGTESLEFEASSPLSLAVTLGGQALSYSALSVGTGYTVYGANIPTAMDGQTEALTFSMGSSQTVLDNIAFSTMSIPEPPECAIIGLGAILFVARCGRKYRQVRC